MRVGFMIVAVLLLGVTNGAARDARNPLGPFVTVRHWAPFFLKIAGTRPTVFLGRRMYAYQFGEHTGGGAPEFSSMAVGHIGPGGTWIAAIPMDSGGSGGAFDIFVFAMSPKGPHFIGDVHDGDRLWAFVSNGLLHEGAPDRDPDSCNGCHKRWRIFDYRVSAAGLQRVGTRVVSRRNPSAQPTTLVVGTLLQARARTIRIRNTFWGDQTLRLVSGAAHARVKAGQKVLAGVHDTGTPTVLWVVPYQGGMDL